MRRETAVGLAWAGGLVLLMVAVFFYGLSVYEPERFEVVWTDTEHEATAPGSRLAEGASASHTFEADGMNVTSVRIILEWDDDVGNDNDRFELSVSGPGELTDKADSAEGSIEHDFRTEGKPDATRVEGANAEHALEQLDRPADLWEGVAAWNVTVRLISAEGDPGTQGLVGATEDTGNDYTVRFIRVTTDAVLTPL